MGFEILHRSYSLGISARTAEWFVRWTREMASRPVVNMDNFEEGLGRIMYVAGALEYERPFLAPLYKFLNVPPTRFHQKVAFLCCVHSKTPVEPGGEERTLLVCDADASDRHLPQSGRTSERDKDGNRRMATSS